MIFQQPQWPIKTAYDAESYGFMQNRVAVNPKTGAEREAFITIPTELFQLVSAVFSEAMKAHAATAGTQFYLDEVDALWVFGVETLDGEWNHDLWPYTRGKLPPWADVALSHRR